MAMCNLGFFSKKKTSGCWLKFKGWNTEQAVVILFPSAQILHLITLTLGFTNAGAQLKREELKNLPKASIRLAGKETS